MNKYNDLLFRSVVACAQNEKISKLRKLLSGGADPNELGGVDDRFTGSYLAAQNNNIISLSLLLEYKANPNIPIFDQGITPLHIACIKGNHKCVKLLLDHKAEPNIPSLHKNVTPIYSAIHYDNNECVKILLDHKVNPDVVSHSGQTSITPLHQCVICNNIESLKLLIERKADLEHTEKGTHSTPLEVAVSQNSSECLKVLIEAGAVYNRMHPYYEDTPLHIANQFKYTECEKIIKDYIETNKNEKLKSALREKCPICHETMNKLEDIQITDCYHSFHVECWEEFIDHELELGNDILCPLCRSTIVN